MASTSRTLFLLSLLVASFCMTVTASRSLEETNKLSPGDLDKFVHSKLGLIDLVIKCDLSEVLHPVQILLKDAADVLVELEVVEGLVTELEPIKVKVTVDGTVTIVVKLLGKKVRVALKLSELDPVLETVGGVLHVVVKLVEGLKVLQLVDPVTGEIQSIISGLL